ncbi:class II glutamine amidotransferase [Uliginosibacterium paludis]|uniref:Class II glutamine amidotransferase n=1 Tax=Uliginosibacterium paludis TaxID=1615952 RepID=A0ABV2CKU5_9RHOO
MCQLLGMNSFKPARLSFSLAGFIRRGGDTDEHADGWGLAMYEERRCRLTVDPQPSARSPLADLAARNAIHSRNVIAHIRKATQGDISQLNCHPFVRELWGREWSFAHNGNLDKAGLAAVHFHVPRGQTDSEWAFCLLMDALQSAFGEVEPSLADAQVVLAEATRRIALCGTFNFMLSNGEVLFVHRSTELHFLQRRHPFGCARLLDCPMDIDFSRVNHPDDRMSIIATKPLTNECWQPLPTGELVAFRDGARSA